MNERALRVLEFTKIREQLCQYALSGAGRESCLALTPLESLKEVISAQDETEEAVVILTYQGGNPMMGFEDVGDYLVLAEKGSTLSPKALLTVADTLHAARGVRSSLVTERENTPLITAIASNLQPLRLLEEDITNAIISEEEISDHASPALLDIRRHIRQANDRVREKLNSMAHGSAFSKYLMEPIVTVRNGRYVLPVKAEHRGKVLVVYASGTVKAVEIEEDADAEKLFKKIAPDLASKAAKNKKGKKNRKSRKAADDED